MRKIDLEFNWNPKVRLTVVRCGYKEARPQPRSTFQVRKKHIAEEKQLLRKISSQSWLELRGNHLR